MKKDDILLKTRPPLESDNLNETLKLNRLLAHPIFIVLILFILDYLVWILINFGINIFSELPLIIKTFGTGRYHFDFKELLFKRRDLGYFLYGVLGVMAILNLKISYQFRISYSEKAINKGSGGTSKWATIDEVKKQYKEVSLIPSQTREKDVLNDEYTKEYENGKAVYKPKLYDKDGKRILKLICDEDTGKPIKKIVREKTNYFPGKGGIPISRWRHNLYIDYTTTNNLFVGTTRSGKGEMFVYQLIDCLSRAEKQIDRPSLIIFEPKLELYKSCSQTLRDRGYRVLILNLDNPLKSAGYNPLAIVTEYYKRGKIDEAQQLAKSFSFSIFNGDEIKQEPIWKQTATDLFTALIISVVSDSIALDEKLNFKRRQSFLRLQKLFENLSDEEKEKKREIFREKYIELGEDEKLLKFINENEDMELENYLEEHNIGIPDFIEIHGEKIYFEDLEAVYPNEKKINCFSAINFFQRLTNIESGGTEGKRGKQKADVALDEYFNRRPPLDYARSLYASIKSAGGLTKGSIYVNMQSSLTIFMQDNIARLTAESDIDIKGIGFDIDTPTAVFIGIPTEDKSNHFIATTFVNQVFQYLWKLAKEDKQVLSRELVFILDEFGNMPALDNFASMVTNCLGAKISFNIFLQSYAQLRAKYGEDESVVIKDNFANHFYILSSGVDSSEEFSKQLGNKTVIEIQRSGVQFSGNKSIMENNKERPLKFPAELREFREGETAVYRVSKRTDRAGAAMRSYPILNEYQDNISIFGRIKAFCKFFKKRIIKGEIGLDRGTGDPLSFKEELNFFISEEKRWQGTAFLYRYQYMALDFPNPTEIEFSKIFNEKGREDIDYQNRVVDIDAVLTDLGIKTRPHFSKTPMERRLCDLAKSKYFKFDNLASEALGIRYKELIGINDAILLKNVMDKIKEYVLNLPKEKQENLKKNDFIGQLQKIIIM